MSHVRWQRGLGNKIDAEGAGRLLAFDTAELKARSLGEDIDVRLQPSREVKSFVLPHLTQPYAPNAPNPLGDYIQELQRLR